MGLLDGLRSRGQSPLDVQPLRSAVAAIPVLASADIVATGVGSVCIKPPNKRLPNLATEVDRLGAFGEYDDTTDSYGHRWLTRRTEPTDFAGLVDGLAAVNAGLSGVGLADALLCSMLGFTATAGPLALVYLPWRGSWYPFVPIGESVRDNERELALRDMLAGTLMIERDLTRWSPLWGAPGLP